MMSNNRRSKPHSTALAALCARPFYYIMTAIIISAMLFSRSMTFTVHSQNQNRQFTTKSISTKPNSLRNVATPVQDATSPSREENMNAPSEPNNGNKRAETTPMDTPSTVRVFEVKSDNLETSSGEFQQTECTGDCLIPNGILSPRPPSFFRAIQQSIDNDDLQSRCTRYNFQMNHPNKQDQQEQPPVHRRIFYGSLIADEPWEVLDIIAAETHSIFAGMVLVESNRTQAFHARPFKRDQWHAQKLQRLFHVPHLQIRQYVNETYYLRDLDREHAQRQEILHGWKEMGMGPNDIGYIADLDETFTRDFLRAVQSCPYVEALDYETHYCSAAKTPKMLAATRVFEGSPDCIADKRSWYHPDMVIGACIEHIGDEQQHPFAQRSGFWRVKPYNMTDEDLAANKFPLWSAGDFRMEPAGKMYQRHDRGADIYTGYHFHNWFSDLNATRFKYLSYGHPVQDANTRPMEEMHDDLKLMIQCVNNETEAGGAKSGYARVQGGLRATRPPWPIYFQDNFYRQQRHTHVQQIVQLDKDLQRNNLLAAELRSSESKTAEGDVLANWAGIGNYSVVKRELLRRQEEK